MQRSFQLVHLVQCVQGGTVVPVAPGRADFRGRTEYRSLNDRSDYDGSAGSIVPAPDNPCDSRNRHNLTLCGK